jgi:sugar phosphate isomerase/epimerase
MTPRHQRRFAAQAWNLCNYPGFPNAKYYPPSQLDPDQLEYWVEECTLRLTALARYLAVLSPNEPEAAAHLRKVRRLVKAYRVGYIN